ncbi:MAG: hypothetical protein ABH804_01290 [archaeon]
MILNKRGSNAMIKQSDKKGLSAVIITLIMIALALFAVGIIWVVVTNLLGSQEGSIDIQQRCLAIDVRPLSGECAAEATPDNCEVILKRNAGGEEITGVMLVFSNGVETEVVDEEGDIEILDTKLVTASSEMTNTSSVEVSAYLLDNTGKKVICTQTKSLQF